MVIIIIIIIIIIILIYLSYFFFTQHSAGATEERLATMWMVSGLQDALTNATSNARSTADSAPVKILQILSTNWVSAYKCVITPALSTNL